MFLEEHDRFDASFVVRKPLIAPLSPPVNSLKNLNSAVFTELVFFELLRVLHAEREV